GGWGTVVVSHSGHLARNQQNGGNRSRLHELICRHGSPAGCYSHQQAEREKASERRLQFLLRRGIERKADVTNIALPNEGVKLWLSNQASSGHIRRHMEDRERFDLNRELSCRRSTLYFQRQYRSGILVIEGQSKDYASSHCYGHSRHGPSGRGRRVGRSLAHYAAGGPGKTTRSGRRSEERRVG